MAPYLMADLSFLQDHLIEFILTIIAVVIADMAVSYYLKTRANPKIIIKTLHEGDKLGFSVEVEKKTIKDARVRCNGINYPWESSEDVKEAPRPRKDLFPGDTPSFFYPFKVTAEYVDDISKFPRVWCIGEEKPSNGIVVTVKEISTQKNVYTECYAIPKDATAFIVYAHYARKPIFNASIRVIGEGVEEKRDYSLRVGLNNLIIPAIREGKPIMEYISAGFELKKRFLWSR